MDGLSHQAKFLVNAFWYEGIIRNGLESIIHQPFLLSLGEGMAWSKVLDGT
jgi:hypothetical protein